MSKELKELTLNDAQDWALIFKYAPFAKQKQRKKLKELLDLNAQYGDVSSEQLLKHISDFVAQTHAKSRVDRERIHKVSGIEPKEYYKPERHFMNIAGSIKADFKLEIRQKQMERDRANAELAHGTQMSLFHPEAFEGGENKTLREM